MLNNLNKFNSTKITGDKNISKPKMGIIKNYLQIICHLLPIPMLICTNEITTATYIVSGRYDGKYIFSNSSIKLTERPAFLFIVLFIYK